VSHAWATVIGENDPNSTWACAGNPQLLHGFQSRNRPDAAKSAIGLSQGENSRSASKARIR